MLSEQIQKQVTEEAPIPSKSEIEDYYEAAKSSQYTTPESRDIRVIKNPDKAKVEEAKAALEKDDSIKSWEAVAKKYSTDTTKSTGGLQSAVTEGSGTLQEPLEAEVFAAEQGELEGPLKEGKIYTRLRGDEDHPGKSPVARRSQVADQRPARRTGQTADLRRLRPALRDQVAVAHLLRLGLH